jgi:filamentous hemagglutinin family protein
MSAFHASHLKQAAICVLIAFQPILQAASSLPTGGSFAGGAGSISAAGNTLVVNQSTLRGIIDWNNFSIAKNGSVTFNNGSGATLNRATGGLPSAILGQLLASGSVYILNPQGVLIGHGATIHTGGDFLVSTLNLSNSAFLNGGSLVFSGPSTATVVNLGDLTSTGGSIYLVGHSVQNGGSINAPNGTIGLAAGSQVLITDSAADQRIFVQAPGGDVTNSGYITAAQVELRSNGGNIYALAGNNGGQIRATGTATRDGHVWLIAENGTANVSGLISATNANGTGGNVETSGSHVLTNAATIATGKGGNWLLDPNDITIDSTLAGTIDTSLNGGTNVTEQTTASGTGGSGVITVASPIAWATGANLTLSALTNIVVNAGISNTGAGSLTLRADNTSNGTGAVTLAGLVDFSASTGNVAFLYDPTGSASTKYITPVSYSIGTAGTQVKTNSAWVAPANGSVSTQSTAYMLVNNVTDLQNINTNITVTGIYALGTNIDASSTSASPYFTPIGGSTAFVGIFDGLGRTINGLTVDVTTGSYGGMFAQSNGKIRNVNLTAESVTGSVQYLGGLIGRNNTNGVVANVNVISTQISPSTVSQTNGETYVGGLAGWNSGIVENSSSSAAVSAAAIASNTNSYYIYAGGLIGVNVSGSVSTSYSSGSVTIPAYAGTGSSYMIAAGLAGYNSGSITSSFASGAVNVGSTNTNSGDDSAGGLVGLGVQSGTIVNSYAIGAVAGGSNIHSGGLVGYSYSTVTSSYAVGSVSAATAGYGGGLFGYYNSGTVTTSYWDPAASATNQSAPAGNAATVTGASPFAPLTSVSLPNGFSSANWAGVAGFYPFLLWQGKVISGDVLTGTTPVASVAVDALANGVSLGTTMTNGSGFYSFFVPTSQLTNASGVLTYLAGATSGNTFSNGLGGYAGMNIYTGVLSLINGYNSTLSGLVANLGTAVGSHSGSNFMFNISGGLLNPTFLTNISVTSLTPNFSINQVVSTTSKIFVQSAGNLTLANGAELIAGSASPATSTLVVAGAFTNNGGSSALTSGGTAGSNWLIYSQNPANDTIGGLPVAFKQYNATYGVTTPHAGNGLLYSYAPFITPTLIGTATKTYDGTTSATLAAGNFGTTGAVSGDTVNLTSASSNGNSANVGSAIGITATGIAIASASSGGIPVYGYQLASTTATGNIGTIIPKTLTATITAVNKIYNQTNTATGSMTLSGFIGSDSSSLANAAYAFASPNASTNILVTESGAVLGNTNYQLGTVGTTSATITPKTLTATISAVNKIYNQTTNAAGSMTLSGFLGADSSTVANAAYAFASPNAGNNILVTESGAVLSNTNYQLSEVGTTTATITRKTLAATITAGNKTYDQTTTASGTMNFTGVINGDTVAATGADTYAFTTANAGNGITVTESGTALSNGNYQLGTVGTTTANIIPKTLTATITAGNKIYDQTTTATGRISLSGFLGEDSSSATNAAYAFASPNAGNNITVTESGAVLSNTNYQLGTVETTTANIAPKTITATITAGNKTYDQTTAAAGTMNFIGVINGDIVAATGADTYAFSTANAGNGITVTESGATLSNSNYQLVTVGTTTANITPKALTAIITAGNKTYDQTTTATGSMTLSGFLGEDSASASNAAYTFASANAGNNITVTESGATLSNPNYQLPVVNPTTTANIAPKTITATITAGNKTYDQTTTAAGSITLSGFLGDDSASVSNATYAFASPNAGTNITVTESGSALSNGNYQLGAVGTTTANITPKTLTATITAGNKTYDGTTAATGSMALGGILTGDTVSVTSDTYAFSSPNAGNNLTVTEAGAALSNGNYQLGSVAPATANISPATLTYTALSGSRPSGSPNPTLTGSVTGFVGNESLISATTGNAIFTTPATTTSSAGTYAIDGSGLTANYGNYVFTQAATNATALTVTAAVVAPTPPPTPTPTPNPTPLPTPTLLNLIVPTAQLVPIVLPAPTNSFSGLLQPVNVTGLFQVTLAGTDSSFSSSFASFAGPQQPPLAESSVFSSSTDKTSKYFAGAKP